MQKAFRFSLLFFVFYCLAVSADGKSVYSICTYYFERDDRDSLLIYLNSLPSNLSQADNTSKYLFFSRYYEAQNDLDNQLKYLYKAKQVCANSCPDTLRAFILDDLALTLSYGGVLDRQKAINYINQSIGIKKTALNQNQLANGYFIKSSVLYYSYQFSQLNIPDETMLDSAIYFLSLAHKLSIDKRLRSMATSNLAAFLIEKGELDEAEELLLPELKTYKEQKDFYRMGLVNNSMANIMILKEEYGKADELLDSLIKVNQSHGFFNLVETSYYYRINIADTQRQYKRGTELRDSLTAVIARYNDIKNYEAQEKYNSASLEVQLVNEQTRRLRNRAYYIGLSIILLIMALGGYIAYRIQKFRKMAIQDKLERAKIQGSLDAARAQLEGEQKEREAIAAKLHNELASSLSACQMHIHVLKKQQSEDKTVKQIDDLVASVNRQVRDISHQLVSPLLLKYGLKEALKSTLSEYQNPNTTLSLTTHITDQRFSRTKEVFIYQTSLECIQNAFKHAKPSWIKVDLMSIEKTLILTISNDGCKSGIGDGTGLGHQFTKEKALALGGQFAFIREENRAISTLRIPVD